MLISVNQPYLNIRKYNSNIPNETGIIVSDESFDITQINIKLDQSKSFSFIMGHANLMPNEFIANKDKIVSFLLDLFDRKQGKYQKIVLLCEYMLYFFKIKFSFNKDFDKFFKGQKNSIFILNEYYEFINSN